MKKHTLIPSAWAIACTGLLFLSATSFNAVAEPGEEEELSNNLSVPAIFAEGYGLAGLPANSDKGSGLPGSSTSSTWGTAYCYGSTEYFLQQDATSNWQAEWSADALNNPDPQVVEVTVDWSEDIIGKEWNDKSVIPIGVTLSTDQLPTRGMLGYDMTSFSVTPPLCSPLPEGEDLSLFMSSEEESEELDEIWGTNEDATYASSTATVYSVCARLTIQKLTGQGGTPVGDTLFDSAVYEGFGIHARPTWYSATIDGAGKIVYLYNWNLAWKQKGGEEDRTGWYRLTFSLDPEAQYTTFEGKMQQTTYTVPCNTSLLQELHWTDTGGVYQPQSVDSTKMYVDIKISGEHIEE